MAADPNRPSDITEEAWALIQTAKAVALSRDAGEVDVQHLFQAVAARDGKLVQVALAAQGLGQTEIETCIDRVRPPGALPDPSGQRRRLSAAAQAAVDQAKRLAAEYPVADLAQMAPVHLWVGLCAGADQLQGWLVGCGWPEESVRRLPVVAPKQLPERREKSAALQESSTRVLNKFCHRNLTELARQGRVTCAHGMEDTREQLVHCLLKRNKPSVVLTGPAGVGKTKLVEDLATRIAQHEILELDACEVFELDLALFTRGTHLVGSRAERWTELTTVLRAHPERVILFIDELHTVVGLPIEGQAMDMSNALKPLLVDSKVRIIGATTADEYRRYIEGDPALARRFTEIKIPEPDRNTMLGILRAVAPEYETCHGVRYSEESLEAIYDVAHSYIPSQSFPAKAVDLLDEVGVRVKMKSRKAQPIPPEAGPLIEASDVKDTLKRIWGVEPEALLVDIAALLKERVVGQDHAARKLSDVIITSAFRYGKEERREPRAIILFLGPPGVGKSYMAQALSDVLFPGRDRLLTLDMTEFSGVQTGEHRNRVIYRIPLHSSQEGRGWDSITLRIVLPGGETTDLSLDHVAVEKELGDTGWPFFPIFGNWHIEHTEDRSAQLVFKIAGAAVLRRVGEQFDYFILTGLQGLGGGLMNAGLSLGSDGAGITVGTVIKHALLDQLQALVDAGVVIHTEIPATSPDLFDSMAQVMRGRVKSVGLNDDDLLAVTGDPRFRGSRFFFGERLEGEQLEGERREGPEGDRKGEVGHRSKAIFRRYERAKHLAAQLDVDELYVHGNDVDLIVRRRTSRGGLRREVEAAIFAKGVVILTLLQRSGRDQWEERARELPPLLAKQGFVTLLEFAKSFAHDKHPNEAERARHLFRQVLDNGYFFERDTEKYSVAIVPVLWPTPEPDIGTAGAGDITSSVVAIFSGK